MIPAVGDHPVEDILPLLINWVCVEGAYAVDKSRVHEIPPRAEGRV